MKKNRGQECLLIKSVFSLSCREDSVPAKVLLRPQRTVVFFCLGQQSLLQSSSGNAGGRGRGGRDGGRGRGRGPQKPGMRIDAGGGAGGSNKKTTFND